VNEGAGAGAAEAPLVRLRGEGLHVVRGGKAIVRGVDLEARGGEVLAVVGPSGAGKSTLFRALVGELPAERGRVLLAGAAPDASPPPLTDVTGWPLWKRSREGLGYVPQNPSVLWNLTVRGNLATFHRIVHGHEGDPARDAARVDLAGRLDVQAGELSAGERRRLELARALVRPPRVLICDEPFAGVDPAGSARIAELLRDLALEGVAIVLADHHVAEALALATHALLLLDGQIAVSDTPQAFVEHPIVRGRYLGSWTRTIPPPPPRSSGRVDA
jgi:lipopolysaccharide export system ATP-binding protein